MDEIKCTCVIKGDRQQAKVQIDYKESTRHEDFYYFRISFDRESNCFLEWDIASNRLRKLYRQWLLKWITISFPLIICFGFFCNIFAYEGHHLGSAVMWSFVIVFILLSYSKNCKREKGIPVFL